MIQERPERKGCWGYAIQNETNGRVYIGQTADLEERIKKHNSGQVYSTKKELPWKLIARLLFRNRSQAMWVENELKRSRGKRLRWIYEFRLPLNLEKVWELFILNGLSGWYLTG